MLKSKRINNEKFALKMEVINSIPSKCSYCIQLIDSDDFLNCTNCKKDVHIKCLKRPGTPGDLLGDVFFDFTCCHCTDNNIEGPSTSSGSTEKFIRKKMPWFVVITLAIYNLSIKSKGLSRHGYFHWRTHIVNFIDKNWYNLFDSSIKRPKKWIGCVSGVLSTNSPGFFESGHDVFQEYGWWKLKYSNQTPKFCYKIYEQLSQKRQQLRNDKRQAEDNYSSDISSSPYEIESKRGRRIDSDEDIDSCSRTLPYMGRKRKLIKQVNTVDEDNKKHLNTIQSSLMDFLAENLSSDDLMFNEIPIIGPKDDLLPLITPTDNCSFFDFANANIKTELCSEKDEIKTNDDMYRLQNSLDHLQNADNNCIKGEGESEIYLNNDGNLKSNDDFHNLQSSSAHLSNELKDSTIENIITVTSDPTDKNENPFEPRIVQVTNFQQLDAKNQEGFSNEESIKVEGSSSENEEGLLNKDINISSDKFVPVTNDHENPEEDHSLLEPCEKSLFTKTTRRELPWLIENINIEEGQCYNEINFSEVSDNESGRLVLMSDYEEKDLQNKLRKIISLEETCKLKIPSYIRRFYRKLVVREMKRINSKPIFNLDVFDNKNARNNATKISILDRYQLLSSSEYDRKTSFYARIAGSFEYELFESPYTSRILHPFIYRNKKCFPHWLKLMCEIQYTASGVNPTRATVDFCYVRPNHIAAVNALLQTVFWPGIDMSECLSYPDFSVVALYKKLVVGCAFLVPDVAFNEAYISFLAVRPGWQRCGIATFMLYHLIQTCMSKDITLHVAATNPAVCLYQKFGFKIEEVILDFYEKFLPIDSTHSRHAFFLRLMR